MDEMDNRILVQFLIDNGEDVNAKNKYGLTPLHFAVLYRNHCVIDILFQAGADINAKSCLKRTALHFAINSHQHKKWKRTLPSNGDGPDMWMVKKLLDQENIRVNARDIRGDTPLMWAVMDKQVDIVLALMRKGANPNIRNKDSLTPLHVALSDKDPCSYVVVALLFHQASLNIADKEGNTPIDILIQHVRNTQSYQFAYTCLETIAFTHRVKKHQWRKLEKIPELASCLEKCCYEVKLMKLDVLANRLSVFHFMLLGADDSDLENPVLQVYEPIVRRLLAGIYPKYVYNIFERIPKSVLCIIFEILFMKNCEGMSDVSGKKSDNNSCGETSDNDYCGETCDNHSKETSNIDDCRETSDKDFREDTSDNGYCVETSDDDDSEETQNIEQCQETSENGGCEVTLDNKTGNCDETFDNDTNGETPNIDQCKEKLDNSGRKETLDNDGRENMLNNDSCEDTPNTDDCEETSVNDGCESFENNGSEEMSVNGGCKEAWDIEDLEVVKKRIKGDPRDFFSKIDIFILSEYLSCLDVFCLIVALSKGEIHECLRDIRKMK